MSTANPLHFIGGMILEIGAAIGVMALLWPGTQASQQPSLPNASYYAPQEVYPPGQITEVGRFPSRGDLLPESRGDFASERPLYQPLPATRLPSAWQERGELLPPAPASFDPLLARTPQVAVARPYVRTFDNEPAESHPTVRTARSFRGDYYSRY